MNHPHFDDMMTVNKLELHLVKQNVIGSFSWMVHLYLLIAVEHWTYKERWCSIGFPGFIFLQILMAFWCVFEGQALMESFNPAELWSFIAHIIWGVPRILKKMVSSPNYYMFFFGCLNSWNMGVKFIVIHLIDHLEWLISTLGIHQFPNVAWVAFLGGIYRTGPPLYNGAIFQSWILLRGIKSNLGTASTSSN